MKSSERWTYSTTLPQSGEPHWHSVGVTFESMEDAAEAAKNWLIMAATHNHFVVVRLDKINEV